MDEEDELTPMSQSAFLPSIEVADSSLYHVGQKVLLKFPAPKRFIGSFKQEWVVHSIPDKTHITVMCPDSTYS